MPAIAKRKNQRTSSPPPNLEDRHPFAYHVPRFIVKTVSILSTLAADVHYEEPQAAWLV